MNTAILLAGLLLAPQEPERAPEIDPQDVERARASLEAFGRAQSDFSTLRAKYVQERTTPLVEEPLVSNGRLYFREDPGCVVFEAIRPRIARIRLDSRIYQVYRPGQKQVERFVLGSPELPRALFQAFSPDVSKLLEDFRIADFDRTDERDVIDLVPKKDEVRDVLRRLVLTMTRGQAPELRAITYVDGQGDKVALTITDVEKDPKDLDDDTFSPEVPDDVRVIVHEPPDEDEAEEEGPAADAPKER